MSGSYFNRYSFSVIWPGYDLLGKCHHQQKIYFEKSNNPQMEPKFHFDLGTLMSTAQLVASCAIEVSTNSNGNVYVVFSTDCMHVVG